MLDRQHLNIAVIVHPVTAVHLVLTELFALLVSCMLSLTTFKMSAKIFYNLALKQKVTVHKGTKIEISKSNIHYCS